MYQCFWGETRSFKLEFWSTHQYNFQGVMLDEERILGSGVRISFMGHAWTRFKPFCIVICPMTMTLIHLTLLVLTTLLPPPFTWFHFFHAQTVTFSSNDNNTRSGWLCLLEGFLRFHTLSSSFVPPSRAFFLFLAPGSVVGMGPVIYYLHAWIGSDMCVCAFFGLFFGSVVFWWVSVLGYTVSLSCFFSWFWWQWFFFLFTIINPFL